MWSGLLRVMQRIVHYKHGDRLEFKINFSVRDLLTDKGRAVKDQFEALVQAIQKAGSYQAKEEATRAMHAVMDAMTDLVPRDVLMKLSDSLPVREAARLRQAAAQRLHKGETATVAETATVVETAAVAEDAAALQVTTADEEESPDRDGTAAL
jgi:uncharacterized protein (DUF2267 family)